MRDFFNNLPQSYMSIGIGMVLLILLIVFVKFNKEVLRFIGFVGIKTSNFIAKYTSNGLRTAEKKFKRKVSLNRQGFLFKVYNWFNEIIINLNLQKSGVTVIGLLLFVAFISLLLTLGVGILLDFNFGLYIAMYIASVILVMVVFRFLSLNNKDKIENEIMDATDLLVSDVKRGIYNAIVVYIPSIHPDIRPYFTEFVDNIMTKGLSFKAAMLVLNDNLGVTFSDFAHKAIMYEEKADNDFDDIFSAILEVNRHKRILRAKNNLAFGQLMTTFIISFLAVAGFALYSTFTEPYIQQFLMHDAFGKFMLIDDMVIFIFVMGYLTSLKAKSFE